MNSWDEVEDKAFLSRIVEICDRVGLPHWMDQGTLLGLVRDGHPVPWDHDLDLSAWLDDYIEVRDAFIRACAKDRIVVREKGARLLTLDWGRERPTRQMSIALHVREGDMAVKYFGVWPERPLPKIGFRILNFFAILMEGRQMPPAGTPAAVCRRLLSRVTSMVARLLPLNVRTALARSARNVMERLVDYRRVVVPAGYFSVMRTVTWDGLALQAPQDAERYLELKYGAGWRTPKRAWNYLEDDGGLHG